MEKLAQDIVEFAESYHFENSSAEYCFVEAEQALVAGDWPTAIRRGLRSLEHSVGVFNAGYRRFKAVFHATTLAAYTPNVATVVDSVRLDLGRDDIPVAVHRPNPIGSAGSVVIDGTAYPFEVLV